jgi:hypothetical protein
MPFIMSTRKIQSIIIFNLFGFHAHMSIPEGLLGSCENGRQVLSARAELFQRYLRSVARKLLHISAAAHVQQKPVAGYLLHVPCWLSLRDCSCSLTGLCFARNAKIIGKDKKVDKLHA